jgi:hypothetical protein
MTINANHIYVLERSCQLFRGERTMLFCQLTHFTHALILGVFLRALLASHNLT